MSSSATPESEVRHRGDGRGEQSTPTVNASANPPQYYEYGSADAYAQAVKTWLWAYNSWHLAQTLTPLYVQQALFNAQQQHSSQQSNTNPVRTTFTNSNTTPPQNAGTQFIVASYGRRFLAETIDFFFCFVLKLMIIYFMVEAQLVDVDKYNKLLSDEADLSTFIDVTQDLFPVEILGKLVTSFIEALYLSYGCGSVPPGQTPGKVLSSIKVLACSAAYPLAPRDPRIILVDPQTLTFGASLMRSLIKNFSLSFMFPLCITMYAFGNNRAMYDIAAGTVVVECTQLGIPRTP